MQEKIEKESVTVIKSDKIFFALKTVKDQKIFWEQNAFLTCSIRTIRIQIRKNYWDLETCRKS